MRNAQRGHRLAAAILVAACSLLAASAAGAQSAWSENQGTFNAYWTVSGSAHVLDFTDGERVGSGYMTGPVTFNSSQGRIGSMDTECVFFTDEAVGSVGRCVWTGPTGDLAYVVLDASGPAGSGRVRGEILGGTGNLRGITGTFSYEANYTISGSGADARIDGYTVTMSGNYRIPRR